MPFYHEDNVKLFDQIKKCDYGFTNPAWDLVSEEAKDFVKSLLVKEPEKRMNCSQMLEHPWFKRDDLDQELKIDKAAFGNMVTLRRE